MTPFQPGREPHRAPTPLAALATPLVTRTLLVALALVILGKAARYAGILPSVDLTDFDAFHIAGRMVWRGDIADAYHLPALLRVQRTLTGNEAFLPWTYPPPFDLVVAGLALLPISLAYLAFVGTTLAAYLLVLARIAGPLFPVTLLALFPVLFIGVASGQNGFLTGTMVGLTGLGLLGGRTGAGVPLGLMVIKPHLAVGLGLCTLLMRRWACLAVAALVAILAAGLATAVLGFAVWPAFLRGVDEAKAFLAAGEYPLFRMVSVYAWLRGIGLSAPAALAAQMATAMAALGLIGRALQRRLPPRQVVGLAALVSLLVSPYAYDYDLPLYGIALALLLPDLLERASRGEQITLLGLGWGAGGYGFVTNSVWGDIETAPPVGVSFAGPILLVLLALIWRILRRGRPAEAVLPSAGPAAA
ncbi:glycosyltransferase family 87 protein [Methylorubrum zatmanii]